MGLIVADELGLCASYVGPLGESVPPPAIVFRDWVELWQIEGDQTDGWITDRSLHRWLIERGSLGIHVSKKGSGDAITVGIVWINACIESRICAWTVAAT